jgi:hypothetical protein
MKDKKIYRTIITKIKTNKIRKFSLFFHPGYFNDYLIYNLYYNIIYFYDKLKF